jgi:TatD DNase family protein
MIFDSHAHLDDEKFDEDREAVIERALAAGIAGIINVGTNRASSAASVQLAARYPEIFAAVGIHPHDAKEAKEEDYLQMAQWAKADKVVAVGEIGLDYYYDLSPREIQKQVFIRQLDVARQSGMPIIIHNRDSHKDMMEILQTQAKGLTGVFHCFSGSLEMAKELIKMGLYISIAGPVTFKNAQKLPEVIAGIPLERLLVETDSPYLTPHPYRGKRNEPAHVRLVVNQIAAIMAMEPEQVAEITRENVKALFGV